MKYWINTISLDHVLRGVENGFTQAGHGSEKGLGKLEKGDMIVFYSPKTAFDGGEPLQSFTAMGEVIDDEPYQVEMTKDFHPFRRNLKFNHIKETSIRPLIDELSFIKDKQHWGYMFRFGLFQIPKSDFDVIAKSISAL
jgi:hypothetical protein